MLVWSPARSERWEAVGAGGGSAPISAPDALPLGRKRSCKLSPALLYTVQGRGRANHRNAQPPFKPDISPTGTNCPNNQHPKTAARIRGRSGADLRQARAPRTGCRTQHETFKQPAALLWGIFTFGTAERSQTSCPFCRPLGLRRSKWRACARCCNREETWRGSAASSGLCPLATTSTRTRVSSKPRRWWPFTEGISESSTRSWKATSFLPTTTRSCSSCG